MAELHPVRAATIGKLVILRSDFGSGWSVMGSSGEHVKFTDNFVGTRTNYCGVEDLRVKAEAAPKTCKIIKLGNFIISPKQPVADVNKPPKSLSKMNPLIKTKPKVRNLVNIKSPHYSIILKKKVEEDEEKLNDKKNESEDKKGNDKKEEMFDQKKMKEKYVRKKKRNSRVEVPKISQ